MVKDAEQVERIEKNRAILQRRGGQLLNLDRALLWSEPLARGWNVYLKAVRTELPTSRMLRELGICTLALLTGALYEYKHHAPDFIAAGGTQSQLDALTTKLEEAEERHTFESRIAATDGRTLKAEVVRLETALEAARLEHGRLEKEKQKLIVQCVNQSADAGSASEGLQQLLRQGSCETKIRSLWARMMPDRGSRRGGQRCSLRHGLLPSPQRWRMPGEALESVPTSLNAAWR